MVNDTYWSYVKLLEGLMLQRELEEKVRERNARPEQNQARKNGRKGV